MTEGAHYWWSLKDTVGVHSLEEFGGHCGRSTAGGVRMVLWKLGRSEEFRKMSLKVGGVQKDVAQGRNPEESWEGWPLTNFSWGYFIPNTSPLTSEFGFRMKKVQKNFHSRSCLLDFCTWLFPDILAFGALVLESFQIEATWKDFFEILAGALL